MNAVLIRMSQDGEYKLIVIVLILGVKHPVKEKNRGTNTRGNVELDLRNIKCFGCHKKCHVVSQCLNKNKESSRVIQADSATPTTSTVTMSADPWIRVLTAMKEDDVDDNAVKLLRPTFKVDVEVEGVDPSTSG